MKKKYFIAVSFLMIFYVIVFSGCRQCIDGRGGIIPQSRKIEKFSEIVLNINADVEVGISSKTVMQIHAQSNVADAITTKVKGDKLIIDAAPCLGNVEPVHIKVFTTELTGIIVNGSGMVKTINPVVVGDIELDLNGSGQIFADIYTNRIDVDLNGSGQIIVNGTSNKQKVEISGSGSYKGLGLRADESRVELSGSGKAEVSSLNSLAVDVEGSGEVFYSGDPRLKSKVTGSGNVTKLK